MDDVPSGPNRRWIPRLYYETDDAVDQPITRTHQRRRSGSPTSWRKRRTTDYESSRAAGGLTHRRRYSTPLDDGGLAWRSQRRPSATLGNTSLSLATLSASRAACITPRSTGGTQNLSNAVGDAVAAGLSPILETGAYYFEDGDLFVVSEDTLFRIHSHFIHIHSTTMANMIASHGGDTTATRPMRLTLVSPAKFEELLWVFYDESLTRTAPPDRWISILLSAQKLHMEHVVDFAISKLNEFPNLGSCDPLSVICAGACQRSLPGWAVEAYLTLCKRRDPLTGEEAQRLGADLLLVVARGREASLRALINGEDQRQAISAVLFNRDPLGQTGSSDTPPSTLDMGLYHVNAIRGNVLLRVGRITFKIHRYFLIKHSPMLAHELERVSVPGAPVCAISLDDVDAIPLSWLLALFYDRAFAQSLNSEQWLGIFGVASKLAMSKVVALAAARCLGSSLLPVDALHRARQLSFSGSWVDEAIDAMVYRQTPPTAEEGSRLGFEFLTKICTEREAKLNRELDSQRRYYRGLYLGPWREVGRPCPCSICRRTNGF